MCTVTYYPSAQGVVLTSNRDERANRALASTITMESWNGLSLYYPKDPEASGTWMACRNDQQVLVLLNGAWNKHESKPPYRRSRGMIVLDLLKTMDFSEAWAVLDLESVEPFTLIAFWNQNLTQHVWDGHIKDTCQLNASTPLIWSSVTLYDAEARKLRQQWYQAFLSPPHFTPSAQDLQKFHTTAGGDDRNNGLMMNRDEVMLTKNITQVHIQSRITTMHHVDLIGDMKSFINIDRL